jgi:hypothetical protein
MAQRILGVLAVLRNGRYTKASSKHKSLMKFTLNALVVIGILVLVGFGLVNGLKVSVSSLIDWIIGVAIFSWLVAITTVPWNIHFQAREVIAEANLSLEKNIPVDPQKQQYALMIARRSLWVAVILHLLSALGLYLLALWQVSAIGYFGSVAALLLTSLRPAIRSYQFLARRLAMIQNDFKYPREDILELRARLIQLETLMTQVNQRLDLTDPTSWISQQQRQWDSLRQDLTRLATAQEDLNIRNQADHTRLAREAQQAIAQLSEDSQFLNQVRDLIRFVKQA